MKIFLNILESMVIVMGLSTRAADFISNSFVMVNAVSKTSMPVYVTDFVYICFAETDCIIKTTDCQETPRHLTSMHSWVLSSSPIKTIF